MHTLTLGLWVGILVITAFLMAGCGMPSALPIPEPGATTLEATDLPLVILETDSPIPDEPRVIGRMKIIDNGPNIENRSTDPANIYDGRISIEIRGASSQRFPKKQYSLETQKADGKNRNIELLGLPRENDWILHAPYSDKTLMRNVIAYEAARRMGWYASRTRFCEVIRNGRYDGVYVLMEKLKRDVNRVALDNEGIEGGYLIEFTAQARVKESDKFFRSPVTRAPVIFSDPDEDEIDNDEAVWMENYFIAAEQALYSDDFESNSVGWRNYFDERAMMDYVLLNELFKNQDAFYISTFLHKSANGKLVIGPAWDFNISSGNSNYGPSQFLEGWMLAERAWPSRLYQDERFCELLQWRWQNLRDGRFVEKLIAEIDDNAALLANAQERNFARWPILGMYIWPNAEDPDTGRFRDTYAAEVAFLKQWLTDRAAWIDTNIETIGTP